MIQILEYITQHYTLFLSVLVLILLAIIGYYADKTNFGQGKNKEKDLKNKIEEVKIDEVVENFKEELAVAKKEEQNNEELVQEEIKLNPEEFVLVEEQNKIVDNNFETQEPPELVEIDSLLPKKELINNDLLNEIEGMELNSLKEKTSFDVPDLDDISLPKIKNLVEKEQDIWKF